MSHGTPVDWLLSKLTDVTNSGEGYSACCPAHEDQRPSLNISEGNDGRALIHCNAAAR